MTRVYCASLVPANSRLVASSYVSLTSGTGLLRRGYLPAGTRVANYSGMTRLALLAFALLLATACGAGQPVEPVVGTITYEVSGGFSGMDRVLTVDHDGNAHVKYVTGPSPHGDVPHVDATTLARLHLLVSDPKFAALEATYLPPPGGADLQDYVITVELDGKWQQTMTRDGAKRPAI